MRGSYQKIQDDLTQKVILKDQYIQQLEALLKSHGIDIPAELLQQVLNPVVAEDGTDFHVLKQGSLEEVETLINTIMEFMRNLDFNVEFHDLTMTTKVGKGNQISSVSSALRSLLSCFFCQTGSKEEVDILSHLTGRIAPRKLTLLIGPPQSGKSVLLKALAGRLRPLGGATLAGEVYYEGDNIKSGRFLPEKISDYVEQDDRHEAVLTVEETLKFSWQCATGGHHSYGRAKDDPKAIEALNKEDGHFALVQNLMTTLGIKSAKDTYVGNAMVRGVSGGQKRRVTIGELAVCPRPIKLLDSISNGLDTATTYDIIRTMSAFMHRIGATYVVSLLQPPPDVFRLFDEIILLSEGHIIYHGPRDQVMQYFTALGYQCPEQIDEADFLQELPTPDGRRFIARPKTPHAPKALAAAWKDSALYRQMLSEMRYPSLQDALSLQESNAKVWYQEYLEPFAGSFWFYFKLLLDRQLKVVARDSTFVKARIGQCLLVGAIAGSLFSDIPVEEISTLNGFLFNTILFTALGSFAFLPIVYNQKVVFAKQRDASLFPTVAFAFTQTIAFFPMQVVEAILYISIVYWSAGLASDDDGSRFITFIVISLTFSVTISQLFRSLVVLQYM